jgi:hypothetical protein
VDLVEHFQQVRFGVDADALDAGQNLGDDLLTRRGVGLVAKTFEIGDELGIEEFEELTGSLLSQVAAGIRFGGRGLGVDGACPVGPAIWLLS